MEAPVTTSALALSSKCKIFLSEGQKDGDRDYSGLSKNMMFFTIGLSLQRIWTPCVNSFV